MTNRTHIKGFTPNKKIYKPTIDKFSVLKHFFEIGETSAVGARSDLTCSVTGLVLQNLVIDRNCGSAYRERANEGDPGAFETGGVWYVNRDVPDCVQPDISGDLSSRFTSQPWENLGTDDFLIMSVGHQLTFGASGTSIQSIGSVLGDGGANECFISIAGRNAVGATTPVIALSDQTGNKVLMPSTSILTASPDFPEHGNAPYVNAIWRKGNKLYRRIVLLTTGETVSDVASMNNIIGDIQPNGACTWFDFIPYGAGVFSFPNGCPDDIIHAIDWHGNDWRTHFRRKSIYPPWAD